MPIRILLALMLAVVPGLALGQCPTVGDLCNGLAAPFVPQVYFPRDVDGGWETYRCLGTGTYDRDWLVAQVGVPLPTDSVQWGAIKAMYR